MIHERDPAPAPDDRFEPGTLAHVVPGNRGRLLDPRRTPMHVEAVRFATGQFTVVIDAFEDAGARWDIPLESVGMFQFALGSARAGDAGVASYRRAVERFDRPLTIACDPDRTRESRERLRSIRARVSQWLNEQSTFLRGEPRLDLSRREGPPALAEDFRRLLESRSLWGIEDAFAAQFVSNPHAGEIVKGHRIVIAELGLVPYEGTLIRDPHLFEGAGSRERRSEHVLTRLAFLAEVMHRLDVADVALYRGLVCDGPPPPPRNTTFVSASFSLDVARSCLGTSEDRRSGVLLSQRVPVERLFMTYLETAHMNRAYREAEAVLLHDADNPVF